MSIADHPTRMRSPPRKLFSTTSLLSEQMGLAGPQGQRTTAMKPMLALHSAHGGHWPPQAPNEGRALPLSTATCSPAKHLSERERDRLSVHRILGGYACGVWRPCTHGAHVHMRCPMRMHFCKLLTCIPASMPCTQISSSHHLWYDLRKRAHAASMPEPPREEHETLTQYI